MSEEGSSSLGFCYIPQYSLNEIYSYQLYPNYTSCPHFHGMKANPMNSSQQLPVFFHDHTLINWGIFTKPRHILFKETLTHIVEIIRSEYHRMSVVHMTRWDKRWKMVMCSTGFVLTYTVRDLELQGVFHNTLTAPRILQHNFRQYGGNVKAFWTGGDPNHYMKAMSRKNGPHLLKELIHPINLPQIIQFLHGRTVMGDNGREIYLIYYFHKYQFQDYDIFLQLGYHDLTTRHISDTILEAIPAGSLTISSKASLLQLEEEHRKSLTSTSTSTSTNEKFGKSTNTSSAKLTAAYSSTHNSGTLVSPTKVYLNDTIVGIINPQDSTISKATLRQLQQEVLPKVMQTLNNLSTPIGCWSDDYTGSRDDLLKDRYASYLPTNTPVLIYPFCAKTFQLGNTLGYYLNDIACADVSGAHFIAVNKQFSFIDVTTLQTTEQSRDIFFQHLPSIRSNPQVQSIADVKKNVKKYCDCLQYCWENVKAPWLYRIPLIRTVLLPAVTKYIEATNALLIGTILNNRTDFTTKKSFQDWLPLVPNVTIQYRCGDNIGFGKTRYGLLPFSVYNLKRIPTTKASYIYVIADSPSRQSGHIYSQRCETILQHLFERLKKQYPTSTIVVKRGGDAFLDYARLMMSSIVFCSASTFCLWPALGNDDGKSHLLPLLEFSNSFPLILTLYPLFL